MPPSNIDLLIGEVQGCRADLKDYQKDMKETVTDLYTKHQACREETCARLLKLEHNNDIIKIVKTGILIGVSVGVIIASVIIFLKNPTWLQ